MSCITAQFISNPHDNHGHFLADPSPFKDARNNVKELVPVLKALEC